MSLRPVSLLVSLPKLTASLTGVATVVVGGLVLVGWGLDIPVLKSIRPDWVTMKPNTAVCFILIGLAVLISSRPSSAHASRLAPFAPFSRLCGWLAGVIGLLSLVEYAFGWNLGIDQWLFSEPAGAVGTSHLGRMAPDTAICFVLLAAGWELGGRDRQSHLAYAAAQILGSLVTTVALIGILSYFTPVLRNYGWSGLTIMALPTAVLFAALGVGLLLAAWPEKTRKSALPADAHVAFDARANWMLLLVFLQVALGITAIGIFYFRSFERHNRAEVESQLSAIADLKANELVEWRKERLADGGILFRNATLSSTVRRFLAKPEDTDAQSQLQEWLDTYATHFRYDQVRLLDGQGVTLLSSPAGLPAVPAYIAESIVEVLRGDQVILQDFSVSDVDQQISVALVVPIPDESDANHSLGVFFLHIDPTVYLYPLIKRWPTPSQTAETLLVRRDGNDALILNELRLRTNSALSLRLPLSRVNIPAVQAALGRKGFMEGLDSQGVPVVAAMHPIPDSPWSLVVRMNSAEVYGPLRTQLRQVVFLIVALVLGAGAGVGLVWRQQRVRFYRDKATAAEKLQESEALLSETGQIARIGGWSIDIATEKLRWTKEVYAIHEVEEGFQPTVAAALKFYVPESRPVIKQAVERAIQSGEPFDLELELFTARNRRIWVHALGRVLFVNERAKSVSGTVQDITERKQTEAQLHLQAAALAAAGNAIIITNREGLIVWANPAFATLTGYTLAEAVGKNPREMVKSDQQDRIFYQHMWEEILAGRIWQGELINRRKDGSLYTEEMTITPVRSAAGEITHFIAIKQDLTERKRAADEIQRLNTELEQRVLDRTAELEAANKDMEAFSYSVSHDLRAPLRSIDGFSRILQEDYAAVLDEEGRDNLHRISTAARRMAQLIEDMLILSRVVRVAIRRKEVDLSALVRTVGAELQQQEPARQAELVVADNVITRGDPELLRVVLENLLANAWKFTGKRAQTRIEFGETRQNGDVSYFVRDNGAGYDAAYAGNLFGPFQRLHSTAEYPGTGIGLATVQRIVRRHGGRVWAEGEVDRGATFHFSLNDQGLSTPPMP